MSSVLKKADKLNLSLSSIHVSTFQYWVVVVALFLGQATGIIGKANINPSVLRLENWFNTLRPRQNGRPFADDIFKCIFLNENVWIPIKISLKFVPKGPINNIPALV